MERTAKEGKARRKNSPMQSTLSMKNACTTVLTPFRWLWSGGGSTSGDALEGHRQYIRWAIEVHQIGDSIASEGRPRCMRKVN